MKFGGSLSPLFLGKKLVKMPQGSTRHSGARVSANPESRLSAVRVWIPGSPLRGAPE
jgi:hypothetical protein